MKQLLLIISVLLTIHFANAQPPKGPANPGMRFGDKITADSAISANELSTVVSGKAPQKVKVKGKVVDVCKMMGCWLKMETTGGTIMIKMKDESFFVPLELAGKMVVAEGTAALKETSVQTLQHYAKDAGKSREEIEAIRQPKKELTMEADGILVL